MKITRYNGSEEEVVIPEEIDGKKVTFIGTGAFGGESSLTGVEVPSSVINIEDSAFNCNNDFIMYGEADSAAQKYAIENNIKFVVGSMPESSVWVYSELDDGTVEIVEYHGRGPEVVIPEKIDGKTVSKILSDVFGGANLVSIKIPSGVTTIDEYTVVNCDNLERIEIPESVKHIDRSAFYKCNKFVIYGKEGSYAHEYAIENNIKFVANVPADPIIVGEIFIDRKSRGEYKVTGKSTVSYMGRELTAPLVKTLRIPDTVFYKGKTLKVTAVYKGAFKGALEGTLKNYHCLKICQVILGKNITTIGSEAFSGCRNLQIITFNSNLTKIGDKAFYNCKRLTQVKLGSKVTTIGKSAFAECEKLNKVTLGSGLTTIGDKAFYNCKVLTQVKLGSKVTTIGKSAFAGCEKLNKVTLGSGLTTIGDSAFNKCIALTAITIPAKVKKIGKQAFYGCKKLKSITISTTKLKSSNVGANSFKGIYAKATIKVPKSKKAAYKKLIKSKGAGKNVKYK
ncbi:MAG: leucine-rich repeat domain-containing protein [Clostridium sp.]|nr:leucine-rich repeat domain-containing protein [Clostridium sp.]MCM1399075.1 leucine-rich repeat domain-containing protein [Clostridium sp.]MCM1459466.1 leucine-rich repeat domain-containing protein [Bacteroides sp.]